MLLAARNVDERDSVPRSPKPRVSFLSYDARAGRGQEAQTQDVAMPAALPAFHPSPAVPRGAAGRRPFKGRGAAPRAFC